MEPLAETIIENGFMYHLGIDGVYYPDLKLPEGTNYPIGRYGEMRRKYLKEYRQGVYMDLLMSGELNRHLYEIEEECYEMLDRLIEQSKIREGVTEQLKAENQMLWVKMMNQMRYSAEEIVRNDLIYA